MDKLDELLPCPVPWCASDVLEIIRSPYSRGYGVVCQNCRAQGPSLATQADAIAAWNRRAPNALARQSAEQAARVAELEAKNARLREAVSDSPNNIARERAAALSAATPGIEARVREADRRKSEALQKASTWFLDYARQHDAKTPPDTVKAGTNYERAHYCETAAFDDGLPAVDELADFADAEAAIRKG